MRSALNQKLRNVVEDLETTKALYEEEVLIKIGAFCLSLYLNDNSITFILEINISGLCTNNTYLNLQNYTYQKNTCIMLPTNKMIPTITIPTL